MNIRTIIGTLSLGLLATVGLAHGTTITYQLDMEFSGADAPAGPSPWMSVMLDDFGGSGTVRLTIDTSGLVGSEFVGKDGFYLNFDNSLDVNSLAFNHVSGDMATTISTGFDSFKADGAGYFDILFSFDNSPPANRLGAGEQVVYDLSLSGITASSFDFLSTASSKGQFHAAAHVQGIGTSAEGSGWIGDSGGDYPVPEPATMLLFGAGLAGVAGLMRRRRS